MVARMFFASKVDEAWHVGTLTCSGHDIYLLVTAEEICDENEYINTPTWAAILWIE